jgi:tetratricopeptide (TPR) repeat protein
MDTEEALEFLDNLVFINTGEHLDRTQTIILRQLWEDERRTYLDIAESRGYTEAHFKAVGAKLWQLLSHVTGERVSKSNFQTVIINRWRNQRLQRDSQNHNGNGLVKQLQTESIESNFVGRDREIAELNYTIHQGAKVILIQGEGGVGKTTLARKYFKTQKLDKVLELWMATDTQNITSAESVVEEWLRRDFNEEPGREFGINLERLRRKLRDPKSQIGIFIDNLETALDRNGKLIDTRRPYVDLLRVLADSSVHSITLVTSRERLSESSIEIYTYLLEGLDEQAWRQFFSSHNIDSNSIALSEMCKAYGGNAKAMQIIRGVISTDFGSDIDAYWQENSNDLLNERQLNDLVTTQFNRLQENNIEAYKLLCRLGCYRYQDITSVPIEGVLCLLWDVAELQSRRVIRALQDLSLIEVKKGQYWLHSVIRAEAIARLKSTPEWEFVNQKAAEFWTQQVVEVKDIIDALKALEAYYHYVEIEDFEQAANVIIKGRGKQWGTGLPLGCSFYQLGLPQKIISVITRIIDHVQAQESLSKLYNMLGYTYRIIGQIEQAIQCYQIIEAIVDQELVSEQTKISLLFNRGLCKLELWEVPEAKECFDAVYSLAEKNSILDDYMIYSQCCLAYLHSCSGSHPDAFSLAENVYLSISSSSRMTLWGIGHSLATLAFTYKNLGNLEKSLYICQETILHCEVNNFTQIKGRVIACLAEIYRERQEYSTAISHHIKSIQILQKIGAKANLANAYYQLGLTYQRTGEMHKSRESFAEAIRLFQEMQAPKQVEKVQKAILCL